MKPVMVRHLPILLLLGTSTLVSSIASAELLYVNFKAGNDANRGTKFSPLRTIREAATRLNLSDIRGGDTIVLSEGVHLLTETVLFTNLKYTRENRLVIRAEVMPDDAAWTPQRMPIIVTVVPTRVTPADGEEARGLEIETSHVTIGGLRITGSPDYYYIDGRQNRRSYPIWRDGKNLDDLLVTQCLFIGNTDVMPLRVAVIARGHGLVVDHCVFYNCENPVVFMDAEGGTSHGNAMRYCLVYNCSYSGVWTTKSTGEDFEFHHNIITGCRTGWISEGGHHYHIHDCIISGNTIQAGFGSDDSGPKTPGRLDSLMTGENVQTSGVIEIEKNMGKNNYLQLREGSFGWGLKAGLF